MKKTFNQKMKIKKQKGTPMNTLKEIMRRNEMEEKERRIRKEYINLIDEYEAITQMHI